MAEFQTITINSQEELDAMFKERVDRAKRITREELEKEFKEKVANYDDFKTKAEKYDVDIADITARLTQATEENETYKTQLDGLNSKVKKYEIDSVKNKICTEFGLSLDLASRLTGEDEETIRADAQELQKIVGTTTKTAPLGSTEPEATDSKIASFKGMLSQLNQ